MDKRRDNEIAGTGNSYTAQFWQYDPRLGRRWNLDPKSVAWESVYAVNRNNPLWIHDPNDDFSKKGGPNKRSKRRTLKQQEKAQKKFNNKVTNKLLELQDELKNKGLNDEEIQTIVQDKANQLAEKHKNKKWLHVWAGVKKGYKSGSTNNQHNHKIKIQAYTQPVTIDYSLDNGRELTDIGRNSIKSTGIEVIEGSKIIIQFLPYDEPNGLDIITVNDKSQSYNVYSTNGMVSCSTCTYMNFATGINDIATINSNNEGTIVIKISNSNIDPTMDIWDLRIQIHTPAQLVPWPQYIPTTKY
jgi:hypothetical protein